MGFYRGYIGIMEKKMETTVVSGEYCQALGWEVRAWGALPTGV